jgi:hypothetical protein
VEEGEDKGQGRWKNIDMTKTGGGKAEVDEVDDKIVAILTIIG